MKPRLAFLLLLAVLAPVGHAHADGFVPHWVSGDLHVHTTFSHDSYGGPTDDNTGPDQAYTLGWTPAQEVAIADARGLDYMAITDHNDTRSAHDPSIGAHTVMLIPGYENSLAGHVQMLGADACYEPASVPGRWTDCQHPDPRAIESALHADGGVFQINHPYDGHWKSAYGDGSAADPIVPDSIEAWNIGPWYYQPPAPAASDNDTSLDFWETYLDAGFHVAATGGADTHWVSTTAVQGVGQPTTWVYVTEPGRQGVLDGIKAGRTTISAQPPAMHGPVMHVEVDADGNGTYESLPGSTVPAGAPMRIVTDNLPTGPVFYRIVTHRGQSNGEGVSATPPPVELDTTVPDASWFYVELRIVDAKDPRRQLCGAELDPYTTYCHNRLGVIALSSAFFIGGHV